MRNMARSAALLAAAGAIVLGGCYGDRYDDEPYYSESDPFENRNRSSQAYPSDSRTDGTWRSGDGTQDSWRDQDHNQHGYGDQDGAGTGHATTGDERFIREVAEANLLEVELGEIAIDRATNPRVREFAQRMVKDHTEANRELEPAAAQLGIQIPRELPSNRRNDLQELSRLQGEEFDRRFMAKMIDDHEKVIRKFEQQARNGRDGTVREFANRMLPHLREHLNMAREIQGQLGRR